MPVLYLKDLETQKGILDYETKNDSFLKMAKILKELGVKNNEFFLYLSQPDLQGVDPFDPNLTREQQIKIGLECKINPWYYFREVIRIPISGSIQGSRFRLNRGNLSLLWLFFNSIDITLVMPRQTGKTIGTQSLMSYIEFIYARNYTIAMGTKDDSLRIDNVKKLRDIRDALPNYLVIKKKSGTDNSESISYTPFNNKYITFVAQKNELAAEAKGRGLTVPVLHIDEAAYFSLFHITYPSVVSATTAARQNAEANNQSNAIILTTTAGRLDTKEGQYLYDIIQDCYIFNETLYDCKDKEDLRKKIKLHSKRMMVYCEFSYRQLGKSDEWFKENTAKISSSDASEIIKRDFLNIWTYGSDSPLFDSDFLKKIKSSQREPNFIELIEDYEFKFYIDKHLYESVGFKSTPILAGLDGSETVGEDFTSLVGINGTDGSVVFTMKCNESNIIKLGKTIAQFLIDHPNILFIPERNSTGVAIIDILLLELEKRNINPLKRIYNKLVQEKNKSELYNVVLNTHSKDRKIFGFRTTSAKEYGRNFLFKNVLKKALDLFHDRIYDASLINQIFGLKMRNGRIDHAIGKHDDILVAYMLSNFVLFFGKNLDYYDFLSHSKSKLLKNIDLKSEEEKQNLRKQTYMSIYKEIEGLEKMKKTTSSEFIKVKIQHRINELKSKLPSDFKYIIEEKEAVSINEDKEDSTKEDVLNNLNRLYTSINMLY